MRFKKIAIVLIWMTLNIGFCLAQSNTTTHVVERGETLTSIAKRYSTTEAEIIKLNPDAAQFVYVGMELVMPATVTSANLDSSKEYKEGLSTNSERQYTMQSVQNDDDKIETELFVGLSINNFTGKDAKDLDPKAGFHIGAMVRYYFVGDFFGEAVLAIASKGYKEKNTYSSGRIWDDDGANYDGYLSTKYTSYNIDIPILIGYKFAINDDVNLKVKVGPYLTYAVSGKKKTTGYKTTYPDIHSSETEHINNETKIDDMKKFKRFGYGIHAGISAEYKRLILAVAYQHAFSKVFDKNKEYEQNVLISLGYSF